jgi:hypothetical protein
MLGNNVAVKHGNTLECACYFAPSRAELRAFERISKCASGASGRIALKHTLKSPHFASRVILITKSERTRDGDEMVRAPRSNNNSGSPPEPRPGQTVVVTNLEHATELCALKVLAPFRSTSPPADFQSPRRCLKDCRNQGPATRRRPQPPRSRAQLSPAYSDHSRSPVPQPAFPSLAVRGG